jgi:hypothetical protein
LIFVSEVVEGLECLQATAELQPEMLIVISLGECHIDSAKESLLTLDAVGTLPIGLVLC